MGKENTKHIVRFTTCLIAAWLLAPVSSIVLFSLLAITHQITYHDIAHSQRLPLVYALQFDYTPHSLLRFIPVAGFSNGIFIATNPVKSTNRPGVILHELRHAQHKLLAGPLFTPIYSTYNQFHLLLGYSVWETYLSNPFERDAYRFSGEQAKYNELVDRHAPQLTSLKFRQYP